MIAKSAQAGEARFDAVAGRALADGADCSYICDVAVLPSHQGTGLGREVVARLVEASRGLEALRRQAEGVFA